MVDVEKVITDAKTQIDIVDFIGRDIELSTEDNNVYYGKCPNCNKIISVIKDTQTFICCNCGFAGDIFNYLTTKHNYLTAIDILLKETKSEYTIDDIKSSIEKDDSNILNLLNKEAAIFFYVTLRSNIGKEGMKYYLNERKLTKATIDKFGLGFAPFGKELLHKKLLEKGYTDEMLKNSSLVKFFDDGNIQDKFRNRVMVPISDENGRVIAFGGRMLKEKKKDDPTPKYLNSAETKVFDKGKTLFALNFAKDSKREGFILCEGYLDVISMHQAGFDNSIASLGTALTIKHANLIKKYRKDVYLAYDMDGPGRTATKKNIDTLKKAGLNLKIIDMSPVKDPDEFLKKFGKDEFEKRIQNAKSVQEFIVEYYKSKMDECEDDAEMEKIRTDLCIELANF